LPQHLAVPLESEGLEGVQNSGGGTWHLPWAVEVFHPHPPLATGCPGVEIAAEGSYQGAEMQGTRRGRGEATAIHLRLIRGRFTAVHPVTVKSVGCVGKKTTNHAYQRE